MSIEVSGLDALVADLTTAPGRAQRKSLVAVRVGGEKVAKTARQFAGGIAHAPHYPRSITSEVVMGGASFEAQVGPDKALTQGALGNILEYGTSHSAPIAHLGPALDLEGPDFMRALGEAGDL